MFILFYFIFIFCFLSCGTVYYDLSSDWTNKSISQPEPPTHRMSASPTAPHQKPTRLPWSCNSCSWSTQVDTSAAAHAAVQGTNNGKCDFTHRNGNQLHIINSRHGSINKVFDILKWLVTWVHSVICNCEV